MRLSHVVNRKFGGVTGPSPLQGVGEADLSYDRNRKCDQSALNLEVFMNTPSLILACSENIADATGEKRQRSVRVWSTPGANWMRTGARGQEGCHTWPQGTAT